MRRRGYGSDVDPVTGREVLVEMTMNDDGTISVDMVVVEPEPEEG